MRVPFENCTCIRAVIQKLRFNKAEQTFLAYILPPILQLSVYAQNLYDAIYLYAHSVEEVIEKHEKEQIRNGRLLSSIIRGSTFTCKITSKAIYIPIKSYLASIETLSAGQTKNWLSTNMGD